MPPLHEASRQPLLMVVITPSTWASLQPQKKKPLMAQTDAPWVLDHEQINGLIHPRSSKNNISTLSIATNSPLADETTHCSRDPRRQMTSFACGCSVGSWGARPRDGTVGLNHPQLHLQGGTSHLTGSAPASSALSHVSH